MKNGDIVYIKVNKEKPKLRAIAILGRDLLLYTYNKQYSDKIVKYGNYEIVGKVSSYTVKL